jgi:hypothetical protein
MLVRSRRLTVLMLASYLLAITAPALFHEHKSCGSQRSRTGVSAAHHGQDHDCSVCQFLAQKPAPVAVVAPVSLSSLVEDVVVVVQVCAVSGVFSAWHSRAPPAIA